MANISSYNQLSSWNEDDDLLFVQQPDAPKKAHPSQMKEYILGGLDVPSVGGAGKYISAISETDGKINATAETMDEAPTEGSSKAVTSGGIKTAIDDSVSLKTATGNPITLTDAANANAEKLSMTIEPIQSGSGDPSPTNVRPISGLTEGKVEARGKNLLDLSSKSTATTLGITFTVNKNDEGAVTSINVNGISTGTVDFTCPITTLKAGTQYILNGGVAGSTGDYKLQVIYGDNNADAATSTGEDANFTVLPDVDYKMRIRVYSGKTVNNLTFYPMIRLSTITDPTFEPYTGATATITLGQTVYGGSVNFKTGEVTVTHANIESYNGESINEPWLSSIDKYVSGATPTTGAQVVYPLATPTTLTLTPAELELLKGNNTITANGTEISIEYYPDNAIGALAERVDNKADITYVDNAVATKANITDVNAIKNRDLRLSLNDFTNNGARTIYESVLAYINSLSASDKPIRNVSFYLTYIENTMPRDLPANTIRWHYSYGEIIFRHNQYVDATIILYPFSTADDASPVIKHTFNGVEGTWHAVLTDKSSMIADLVSGKVDRFVSSSSGTSQTIDVGASTTNRMYLLSAGYFSAYGDFYVFGLIIINSSGSIKYASLKDTQTTISVTYTDGIVSLTFSDHPYTNAVLIRLS